MKRKPDDKAAKPLLGSHGHRKTRAQQDRALATRSAILNAVIAEFAQHGFEGASIRRIAERIGLQHPLIPNHYRSKDIPSRAFARSGTIAPRNWPRCGRSSAYVKNTALSSNTPPRFRSSATVEKPGMKHPALR
jgi:hypothetical protein